MKKLLSGMGVVLFSVVTANAQTDEPQQTGDQQPPTTIGVEYEYEYFGDGEDDLDPWHVVSGELGRRFSGGSVIGRVNWGRRFGQEGVQYEVDAYPKFGKGTYMYLNAGASSDDIFPDRRFGAQIYRSLGNGFEASVGGRFLQFDETDVFIYTGSIGKYSGNWYVTLTPTVADSDSRDDMSASGSLLVRRYFATADDYFGFRTNYGKVPETDILLQQQVDLESWSVRLERQRPFGPVLVRGYVGYREQDLVFDRSRDSVMTGIALRRRF